MGCVCIVCNIKDKYGNGCLSPIEFWVPLTRLDSVVPGFWISSLLYIIIHPTVRLSFQSPSNNLGVIQLDSGYLILASQLFIVQSYFRHSGSCRLNKPWVNSTVFADACFQLSIFVFLPLFSPHHLVIFCGASISTSQLPSHPWIFNTTTAAIICHCLAPHIEKGKEEENGKKKGCASRSTQNILSPPSPTLYICLAPVTVGNCHFEWYDEMIMPLECWNNILCSSDSIK